MAASTLTLTLAIKFMVLLLHRVGMITIFNLTTNLQSRSVGEHNNTFNLGIVCWCVNEAAIGMCTWQLGKTYILA